MEADQKQIRWRQIQKTIRIRDIFLRQGEKRMRRYDFNSDWQFSSKNGEAKKVTLPHDAMIETVRTADAPGGSAVAFFQGGSYTYEKKFHLPQEWIGKQVKLQFEGVYKNAKVSVNGTEIGGCAYGYTTFWTDCGVLRDGENTITVTCENQDQPDSRWYSGAGIYRPVWAWVGEGLTEEDIRITTKSVAPAVVEVRLCDAAVSEKKSPITENADASGQSERSDQYALSEQNDRRVEIYDGEQKIVEAVVKDGTAEIEIPNAELWDENHPKLYTCRVQDVDVTFGIRLITRSSQGLFVNGKSVLLRGGCIHSDNGILGAAVYRESEFRRVRILKEAGYNAIRSSHNPASRDLLDACDFYGMYVMDESWDMWYNHKSPYDYASLWKENYRFDLQQMVNRDYNHPSVILYSIGNEVSEPAKEEGIAYTKKMVSFLHELDATRPVTGGFNLMIIYSASKGKGIYDDEKGGRKEDSGKGMSNMNSTMFNMLTSMVGTGMNKAANSKKADLATTPSLDALDIAGYNYASGRYPNEGKLHPDRLIFGSETFPQDVAKNWKMVEQYPYLIGDFMWTAWDYLGEAGIGTWGYTDDAKGFDKPYPWILSDAGAFDILGNPNGEAFLASAVWHKTEKPLIAVQPVNHPGKKPIKGTWRGTNAIPSWSWKSCEGNKAVVEVYFDCAKIDLVLNGRLVGSRKPKNCKASFKLKYVPGRLEAVAFDTAGNKIGRNILTTAESAEIHVSPEKSEGTTGDIFYVPVTIGDGSVVESNADRKINVKVENGELLAFGSANPRTEEQYQSGSFTTYYGNALAVVRATKAGKLIVHADEVQAEILVH